MDTLPNLFDLLTWTEPKEVNTKRGPMMLRKAPVEDAFWPLWDRFQTQYRMMSFSLSKDLITQKPVLCHWSYLDQEELEKRAQTIQDSRAVHTSFRAPCPPGLDFYPFQHAGIEWITSREGSYIGDDMGLGKTVQAIGAANALPDCARILVVTKASLKLNWQRELKKWLTKTVKIGIAEGQKWPKTPVVVINYDILGKHYNALRGEPWDLVVLDEAQAIKNPQAKRTLQILGHTPSKKRQEQGEKIIEPIPGKRRVALSGTPIENSIQDLWCVLHYLDSKRFPDYYKFCFRYAGMRKEFGRGFVCTGPTNTEELQRILRSTVMIRRLKRDVLKDLPPITRTIHELDPSGLEQYVKAEELAYKTKEKELLDGQLAVELARCEPDGDHFRATVKALGGASFSFEEIAKVRAETAFAMVPKVLPVIEDDISEAGKAIVFGHHRRVLNAIHDALPGSVLVTGETSIQARQAAVDRFQSDPGCKWFIGSTRACGEGITLTAANLVYFVEEDWAPSKISQAESRPHRIGQTGNVLVKHFIIPGTINARMINVCIEKQEMIEKTLDIDPEFGQEPLFTAYRPLGTRKEILSEAMLMSREDRETVLKGLKALNLSEVHQIDAKIVKHLAGAETITQGQAALGRRLLARYSQPGAGPAPAEQVPEPQN